MCKKKLFVNRDVTDQLDYRLSFKTLLADGGMRKSGGQYTFIYVLMGLATLAKRNVLSSISSRKEEESTTREIVCSFLVCKLLPLSSATILSKSGL